MDTIDIAKQAAEIASDKLATDIVLLDTRRACSFADYFVICSGESERQVKAIVGEITERMKEEGVRPLHIEGDSSSGWVLVDYGGGIVHVFAPSMRDYYQLEELWSDASIVVRMQ